MATSQQVDALLLLVCGALSLLIVPGLAFFVGGLAGSAGAARAIRFSLTGTAVVVLLGVLGGYGMLAGDPLIAHVIGRPDPGLASSLGSGAGPYPLAKAGYLLAVCAVSVTIVGVAVSSRITLRAWIVFCVLWCPLVLFPAGYAVFALDDGWAVSGLGVIDFGGALPIGIAGGAAAAGAILACGRAEHPVAGSRSMPLVAIGGALVWIGWLGLTTGSEGAVDRFTSLIAINSFAASAAGCLMWMLVDRVLLRRPTLVSAFCGAFAGLVAITPASGVVTIGWALLLGAVAALACATMVDVAARARFGASMTLTVITTAASLVGLLFIGLFGNGGGMVYSGNFDLFTVQGIAGFAVLIGSFLASTAVALALRFTIGLTRLGPGARQRTADVERADAEPERAVAQGPAEPGAPRIPPG